MKPSLRKIFWLAIDKVVHYDDVVIAVVVRTWRNIACSDPHTNDPSVAKFDTEERLTPITGRCGYKTAEQELTVDSEKFYERACSAIPSLFARTTAIWLIDVGENCA